MNAGDAALLSRVLCVSRKQRYRKVYIFHDLFFVFLRALYKQYGPKVLGRIFF
jgi:hypothetical protein